MKTTLKESKIEKAREDITKTLDKYGITLLEVMGNYGYDEKADERIWKKIEKTYRKAQSRVFEKYYPDLLSKKANK